MLYAEPDRLDLTDEERAAIARPDHPEAWTPADVPLLDELAELLGDLEATGRAAARERAARKAAQAESLEYAEDLVEKLKADEAIELAPWDDPKAFAGWVAGGYADTGPGGSLAERALADRRWTYAHVVVDEAQELSAMAWRTLVRRCPARSMTVVGDLAQTGSAGGADSWAQVLEPVAPRRWRTARLTVNYRTPKPAMALAAALLPAGSEPPVAVRDSDHTPWLADDPGELRALVDREAEQVADGRVAVIAPPASWSPRRRRRSACDRDRSWTPRSR